MTVRTALLLAFALLALPVASLPAQCGVQWTPGLPPSGTDGQVRCSISWDPDGPGPATPLIVFGGRFQTAGTTPANSIATWDPATGAWAPLGLGINGDVLALAAMPNGDLIVGGNFTTAGGAPARSIARWISGTWAVVGVGIQGIVNALAVLPNGDLIAGGSFQWVGSVAANNIARFDGSSWSNMGSNYGDFSGGVGALLALASGDLVAGGYFATAGGGVPARNIASWNGASWSAIGAGLPDAVSCLLQRPNGRLLAGYLAHTGNYYFGHVDEWNGASWTTLGGDFDDKPTSLLQAPNGDVIAGGWFANVAGAPASAVARWNGSSWSAVGGGYMQWVHALIWLPNGDLAAAGYHELRIGRWDGIAWRPLSPGIDGPVREALELPNGDLVIAGHFDFVAGTAAPGIARWNGAVWSGFGSGIDGEVRALARMPNGDLVAGGQFQTAGGVAVVNAARWNGSAWSPLGATPVLSSLACNANGELVAGTGSTQPFVPWTYVARWNGANWSPLTTVGDHVDDLCVRQDGTIVIASWTGVYTWDGTSATWLGSPPAGSVDVLPDGDIVAGSVYGMGPWLGRWNGSTWTTAPLTQEVQAVAALADGSALVATASSTGYDRLGTIWRWSGPSLDAVGTLNLPGNTWGVNRLTALRNGDVLATGAFGAVQGSISAGLARLAPRCRAATAVRGTSCPGPSGPSSLVADSAPWLGGTFRATCTGMAPNALGVALLGLSSPGLPLNQLHPAGAPGCALLASGEVSFVLANVGGRASYAFAAPALPAFAGLLLHSQVVQLEFDPRLQLLALRSSNGLDLTFGIYQ